MDARFQMASPCNSTYPVRLGKQVVAEPRLVLMRPHRVRGAGNHWCHHQFLLLSCLVTHVAAWLILLPTATQFPNEISSQFCRKLKICFSFVFVSVCTFPFSSFSVPCFVWPFKSFTNLDWSMMEGRCKALSTCMWTRNAFAAPLRALRAWDFLAVHLVPLYSIASSPESSLCNFSKGIFPSLHTRERNL